MTQTTWLVTFDGARARAFRKVEERPGWAEFDLGVPEGAHRPPPFDERTSVYQSHGAARSRQEPRTDPERMTEESFVAGLCTRLAEHGERGEFQKLIIAAPPRAMGAFRDACAKGLAARIAAEIDADYVNTPIEHIARYLAPHA
jgi:protein required for attachment to host cells